MTLFSGFALTPSDFRNQQACSVDFPKFLIFFDDHVGLPQGSLEPKNRRPKPHWSGAGAVLIFGAQFHLHKLEWGTVAPRGFGGESLWGTIMTPGTPHQYPKITV